MVFVDGENFTIEAQKLLNGEGLSLPDGARFYRDAFIWNASSDPKANSWLPVSFSSSLLLQAERACYYTTVTGSDEQRSKVRERLWSLGFHAEVFLKPKGSKAKGVDITLTRDMLCHAFQNNYDFAILVAGDGDYVPLLGELKRFGKTVCVGFLEKNGMSSELRLASDYFFDMSNSLVTSWRSLLEKAKGK